MEVGWAHRFVEKFGYAIIMTNRCLVAGFADRSEVYMQKRKTIVYLDQNFASNLAKSLYLDDWKDPLASFYRELYELLSDLTDRDLIICPTSHFHSEETELGNRVKEFLWHFVKQLGYGLSFKSYPEIMEQQVVTAARAYCNLPDIQCPEWEIAFNRDPHVPIRRIPRPDLLVSFPNSQEFNEYVRLSRTSLADEYWTYKVHCRGKRQTYNKELEVQKNQYILEIFKPRPSLNIKSSNLEQVLNLLGLAGVIQFHRSVDEVLQHCADPERFFVSTQLLDCPYIHVWASLVAADIFFHPEKKPPASLFTDFEIVASVLPYVDILATDSYICELVRRAKLSDRFGTKIFTFRQREALLAELQRL
ncbi:MAG: hypothetical protein Q8O55_12060 [Dehalococcoidales bacterium]|nr:hypothetical protein [Dehalococcoidales bacterium]